MVSRNIETTSGRRFEIHRPGSPEILGARYMVRETVDRRPGHSSGMEIRAEEMAKIIRSGHYDALSHRDEVRVIDTTQFDDEAITTLELELSALLKTD